MPQNERPPHRPQEAPPHRLRAAPDADAILSQATTALAATERHRKRRQRETTMDDRSDGDHTGLSVPFSPRRVNTEQPQPEVLAEGPSRVNDNSEDSEPEEDSESEDEDEPANQFPEFFESNMVPTQDYDLDSQRDAKPLQSTWTSTTNI